MTDTPDLRALAEAARNASRALDQHLSLLPVATQDEADAWRRDDETLKEASVSARRELTNAATPARILALLDRAETAERREGTIASAYNIASQAIEDGEAALARLQEENRRLREQVAANTPEIGRVIGHVVWHALGHVHTGRVYGNAEDADRVRQATACHVRERLTVKPVVLARSSSKETQ